MAGGQNWARLMVEQYGEPRTGTYRIKRLTERGDMLTAESIAGVQVALDRLFEVE